MNKHIDDTRLNDYVEGLVTEDVARQVKVHLAACEACSGRLEARTLLLSELAGLPADATPARDLWAGVRAGIEAGSGQGGGEIRDTAADGDVATPNIVADEGVVVPSRVVPSRVVPMRPGRSERTRRFSFSAAQLLAASIVLTVVSGGTVWMAVTGGPSSTVVETDIAQVPGALDGLGGILPVMPVVTTEYRQAIASLESLLEERLNLLDPETVAIIEASLATIDRAIGEARRALADDPNNHVLNRLLIKNQQAKLRVLRQASAAARI